ncbi:RAD55 family ATPase [Amycolatopsis sp. WGS_07]|uniref:RAD55 family ATPase n=1 Tax=Amycolatopsis sp. WGS_07 TaxID=3076764 RepID=UPI003873A544
MKQRLASGCDRLDTILGGGLIDPSITLLAGAPGSGKTVLAQQYAFANADPSRPVVYFSTLTEPLSKITQFLDGLTFCAPDRIGTSVLFEDLGDVVTSGGLNAGLARITEIATRSRCAMLVVDSIKALRYATPDPAAYTRFLYELAGRLSALATSTLWLAEYGSAELATSAEFTIADTTIALSTQTSGQRTNRALQVLKLRGSGFLPGWHAYRISEDGLDAFPRLSDSSDGDGAPDPASPARVSSGIAGLDSLLDGGFWPGSSTIVAGPPGSGKTVMGLHFAFHGTELGQHSTFTTLQESPLQLDRAVHSLGWQPRSRGVTLRCESPNDIYIDEWCYDLLESLNATQSRRLVIDSLTDLAAACEDERRFSEFLHSLLGRCAQLGVSTMLTLEIPDLFGWEGLSDSGVSHLSDNVILLQYQRAAARVDRALTVLKTRASTNRPYTTTFEITGNGIVMDSPADPDRHRSGS